MPRGSLFSVCFLVLFIGNCPKRQTVTRIVYEPPPAPGPAATSPEAQGVLVVAEPQPPEPEEEIEPLEPAPAEKPAAKRRPPRPARPETANEPVSEPEPPPVVEVPALEPRETPNQQAAQRQQITNLQEQVRARLARLEKSNLSAEERRMLEDARTFLSQSEDALANSDFQRAANLARKASMLVAVMEQQ